MSSFVTPYRVTRAITPRAMPVARAAMAAGRFAYQNRFHIARAARGIRLRGNIKRRKARQSKIAKRMEPNKKITGKSADSLGSWDSIAMRRLVMFCVPFKAQGTGVGERNNIFLFLKGIDFCFNFSIDLAGSNAFPTRDLEVHWAVIQSKCTIDGADPNVEFEGYIKNDFFRDNRNETERESPFVDAVAASPFEFKYNCLPLNTDRFNVLTHKRRVIVPGTNEGIASGRNKWKIHKYMKINKRIAFDSPTSIYPKNPIAVVWWYQTTTKDQWPANPDTSLPMLCHYKVKTAFV